MADNRLDAQRRGISLSLEIARVVESDNCTGCGACSLLDENISMAYNERGFLRPETSSCDSRDEHAIRKFRSVCPGVGQTMLEPHGGRYWDDTLGPIEGAWVGYAIDSGTRYRGSSGGVLTALSTWLLASGEVDYALISRQDADAPARTVSLSLSDPQGVLSAAGSRYAPAAVCQVVPSDPKSRFIMVGKPCEVYAARKSAVNGSRHPGSIYLSFFCAGTPSQLATDRLVDHLASQSEYSGLSAVKYRGDGWPGKFVASFANGQASMSYAESWGYHLGRDIQFRCKLCVDGTGFDADVSVGDYWHTDRDGFPDFEDADGRSVVIARNAVGKDLLARAQAAGVISLEPVNILDVVGIQPLQRERRGSVLSRIVGRSLSGKRVPKYRGYRVISAARASGLRQSVRSLFGTFARSIGLR